MERSPPCPVLVTLDGEVFPPNATRLLFLDTVLTVSAVCEFVDRPLLPMHTWSESSARYSPFSAEEPPPLHVSQWSHGRPFATCPGRYRTIVYARGTIGLLSRGSSTICRVPSPLLCSGRDHVSVGGAEDDAEHPNFRDPRSQDYTLVRQTEILSDSLSRCSRSRRCPPLYSLPSAGGDRFPSGCGISSAPARQFGSAATVLYRWARPTDSR